MVGSRLYWLAIGLGALAPVAGAQPLPPILDPKTYTSPSGVYALAVDPTDRHGEGPSDCALLRDGEVQWSKQLPFTFVEASVSDAGDAFGYAFSDGPGPTAKGRFIVAIFDPTGALRREHRTPMSSSRFLHFPPNPWPRGLVVDMDLARFGVRIADEDVNRGVEALWTFSIATGERLADERPVEALDALDAPAVTDGRAWRSILAIRPLPGLSLRLVSFRHDRQRPREVGAIFALLDQEGRAVWTLERRDDHRIAKDQEAENALEQDVRKNGAILAIGTEGRFSLWFVKERARVEFEVRRDEKAQRGWDVVETGRSAYSPPDEVAPEPEPAPEIELVPLGTFALERGPTPPPLFTNLRAWDFAANGDFLTIDEIEEGSFAFRRIDREGRVAAERVIEPFAPAHATIECFACMDDEQWFVAVRDQKRCTTRIRRVNVASGTVEETDDGVVLETNGVAPRVNALTRMPDGGFAALYSLPRLYSSDDVLEAFDAAGAHRFLVKEDFEDATKLSGPRDAAVTSRGEVAVLSNVENEVRFYAASGEHLRTIDLEQALGHEPMYPTALRRGSDGGVLVVFLGDPPLLRLDAEGRAVGRLAPRTEHGRLDARVVDDARVAPDGTIWTTDGRAFLALAEDGLVSQIVGAPFDPTAIVEPGEASIDPNGRFLVFDRRIGNVHVFGSDGRRAFVASPGPAEKIHSLFSSCITSDDEGGLLGSLGVNFGSEPSGYVRFDASGSRLGVISMRGDVLAPDGEGGYWTGSLFEGGLLQVDGKGEALRAIERYPDRRWLPRITSAALDPDGVLVAPTDRALLFVEGPAAEDCRAAPIPRSGSCWHCAATLDWVLVDPRFWPETALLHRRADGASFSWRPTGGAEKSTWSLGFSPDGRELWALESPALAVHRFALPQR